MTWSYYLIYPLACLIGWLPHRIQFGLSGVVRWLLHNVCRYRLAIVRENLRNSFPTYTTQQLREIENRFYNHLADVFVESMTLMSISEKQMRKRMVFANADEFENQTKGKSAIVTMAHYGSWEYAASYGFYTKHEAVYGVYRPLANKGIDRYYVNARSRFGSTPIPMGEIVRQVIAKRRSKQGVIVALIADQAPPRIESKKWFNFLNQPTQFFMGAEKIALQMHIPVYFTHVEKLSRGCYSSTFEMIYDGTESVDESEITRRYVEKLEQMIVIHPELWMWSHRRWKRKPLNNGYIQ